MRGAHRAFFLDDEEKTRAVELLRDHHGTMFEGRYHERNHKPEKPVMWRTAAYVDINAWSAGIVSRYYLTPMMEKGLIKRTDPDHPQSPQH